MLIWFLRFVDCVWAFCLILFWIYNSKLENEVFDGGGAWQRSFPVPNTPKTQTTSEVNPPGVILTIINLRKVPKQSQKQAPFLLACFLIQGKHKYPPNHQFLSPWKSAIWTWNWTHHIILLPAPLFLASENTSLILNSTLSIKPLLATLLS